MQRLEVSGVVRPPICVVGRQRVNKLLENTLLPRAIIIIIIIIIISF